MSAPLADLALATINAQQRADELVRKVVAGELDADDLAIELAPLYGAGLRAFCRSVVKALRRAA